MTLMQTLIECENALGWVPEGRGNQVYKSRAVMHHVITNALRKQGHTEHDFALAVAYCKRRRLPVTSPLQLLPLIAKAQKVAAEPDVAAGSLDEQQQDAIAWEQLYRQEPRLELELHESHFWTKRLTRSVAEGLRDTLEDWHHAGRGPS